MAKVVEVSDPHAAWATMNVKTVLAIFIYGICVGLATAILYFLLDKFIFHPILCRESAALARCASSDEFASGVAIVLGSMLGLVLLVRERVYRPILAILGLAISLWTVFQLVAALPVILAGLTVGILFAIAYVLFSWLVQPTSLVISVVGVVVVSVLTRVILSL